MTATVARVTSSRDPRTAQRIPYAEASRVLLRDSILDGMRELLLTRDWSSITLSDVAKAAGISRQTIYNEFGSRQGLAQGYALRLADRLVDQIEDAIDMATGFAHGQGHRSLRQTSAENRAIVGCRNGPGQGVKRRTRRASGLQFATGYDGLDPNGVSP